MRSACSASSADFSYFLDGDVECFVFGKVWVASGARSEVSAESSSLGWQQTTGGSAFIGRERPAGFVEHRGQQYVEVGIGR